MNTTRTLTLLTLGVLIVGIVVIPACARHRTPEERAARFVTKVSKELDLSEQQKTKLIALKDTFLAARAQARTEHEALFQEAVSMVQSPQFDQAKALQLMERHQALQRQAAPPVIAKLSELHEALTPEQRAKAAEQLKRLHDHIQGRD